MMEQFRIQLFYGTLRDCRERIEDRLYIFCSCFSSNYLFGLQYQMLVNSQQLCLKIQLPPVFTYDTRAKVQIIGYIFDPIQRLALPNTEQLQFTTQNVGSLLTIISEQHKKSYKIYEQSDWKAILRPNVSFAYELMLKVIVRNIYQPSISIQSLQQKSRTNLYQVLEIKDIKNADENELTQQINNLSNSLVLRLQNGYQNNVKNQVSLAPRKIYNPHVFIRTQGKQKYVEYYTKGVYEYYHYGDQYQNDHGWGCAYRSLQTLLSWLNLQNHCKLSKMLTITEIQQIIDRINIGSQNKLKNTNQWIGATQVSWVVKKITNYDCRILHVSDGKDIIQQCEVLREHFEKVGCPVMYGGGEYAYSIVGLNYSWQLGECEFLILDPHYTGADTLDKVIQKKGLSWRKPAQMFKKGIFYNFCLPIIPQL